tara:strand:- start:295 stop:864 length:570 start_codon:yes stop_codon:yes gene_type:complete
MIDFLFIHIPKCGGSSVVKAFDYHHPHYPDKSKEHYRWLDYDESVKKKYSFAVVRDPLARIVSWFFFHKQTCSEEELKYYDYETFQDWFDDGLKTHWGSDPFTMKNWVCNKSGNLIVDDIFFLEEISRPNSFHWLKLKQKIKACESIQLPHEMSSNHYNYKGYFSKERYQKAISICQEDIEFFKLHAYE